MSQNILCTSYWGPGHMGLIYSKSQKLLELKVKIYFNFHHSKG